MQKRHAKMAGKQAADEAKPRRVFWPATEVDVFPAGCVHTAQSLTKTAVPTHCNANDLAIGCLCILKKNDARAVPRYRQRPSERMHSRSANRK